MSEAPRASNKVVIRRLLFVMIGMFAFGYALVPLYEKCAEILGLNGRSETTITQSEDIAENPDESRIVTILFTGTMENGVPWEFKAKTPVMQIQPGKFYTAQFYAENKSGRVVKAQATPSVAPGKAGKYFRKTECFCFTEQEFQPFEGREMPVRFLVDRDLPKDVETITLSYTFFEMPDMASR